MDRTHRQRERWGPPSGRSNPAGGNPSGGARLSVSEKEGKIPKNGKTSFDQPKVFLDFAYLNNLGTEFDKTLIGRNVLNLLLYNFLIIFHTMLYSKIWFKFEFNLLTKV